MAPASFLIVRTSAMGDVIHTLPLASALRRHYPAARISWVVEDKFAPLVAGHPAIDEVITVDLKGWRRRPFERASWRALRRFLGRLHEFAPEVVIDAMGNHKSGLITALTLADRRLGAARHDRREPSSALWISEPVALEGEHAIDRTLSLIAGLGISERRVDFAASTLLAASPQQESTPPLLIHPGAGWRNKEYPPERWGEVASVLNTATGLEVGVLSGPGEEAMAQAVAAASRATVPVLDAPSLPSLAAHLRRARLLLAGDTGPLHLGHALGTPVLCVLGPTDPKRNGVYGQPEANVFHTLPCSFCYKRFDEAKACLLAIDPAQVARRAENLLAAGNRP